MKIILAAIGGFLVLGTLFWWFRMYFFRPRSGTPGARAFELSRHCGWNFLIGLEAWLCGAFAGGSLLLYGVLNWPYYSPEIKPQIVPLTLAGIGAALLLAGRIWYSVALFRLIRNLWIGFSGSGKRALATLLGWLALIPGLGVFVTLAVWCRAPGQSRWLRRVWGIIGLAVGCGVIVSIFLPWWSWIVFYLWQAGTCLQLVRIALPRPAESLNAAQRTKIATTAVLLLLPALIAGAGWLQLQRNIETIVAAADARARECGIALTPEEMYASHPMPENNAYPLYRELADAWASAGAALPATLGTSYTSLYTMPNLTPEVEAELAPWLKTQEKTAALLEKISQDQPMQFPRQWEGGLGVRLPELAIVRNLANYECLRFDQALRDGDIAQALRILSQLKTLQDWVRGDGTLIAGLVTNAIGDMRQRSTEALLNATQLSDAELQAMKLETQTDEDKQRAGWRHNFAGEAFFSIYLQTPERLAPLLKDWSDRGYYPSGGKGFQKMLWEKLFSFCTSPGIIQLNRAFSQNYYADLLDLAVLDYYRSQSGLNALEKTLHNAPLYQILPRMFLPAVTRAHQNNSRQIANQRILRTALAAELYRRRYGHWPERLSDLVPEFLDAVPLDPFNGEELRFKHGDLTAYELELMPKGSPEPAPDFGFDADETVEIPELIPTLMIPDQSKFTVKHHPVSRSGFRVYSVGPNRRDDGGNTRSGQDGNIAFSLYD